MLEHETGLELATHLPPLPPPLFPLEPARSARRCRSSDSRTRVVFTDLVHAGHEAGEEGPVVSAPAPLATRTRAGSRPSQERPTGQDQPKKMQPRKAVLLGGAALPMEHETRFELAFPSHPGHAEACPGCSYDLLALRSQIALTLASSLRNRGTNRFHTSFCVIWSGDSWQTRAPSCKEVQLASPSSNNTPTSAID